VMCVVASCTAPTPSDSGEKRNAIPADTIRLALDWSPNVLHSGIFLAEYNGWYQDEGLHVDWFTTEIDGYKKKPVQRLSDGEVDLAVGPSEHLFFFRKDGGKNPVAVASILQKDRSAFCVKAADAISDPGDLADYTYIGYNTPLEEAVLTAMMSNAGLDHTPAMRKPGRLEVWYEFLKDEKGIAWIFRHWEGALAESAGIELTCFTPADHGVPYGYSSVFMAPEQLDADESARLRKFFRVTERGYREATAMSPDSLAVLLRKAVDHPNFEDVEIVTLAAKSIGDAFIGEGDVWGTMEEGLWETYLSWIRAEVREELPDSLYSADVYFTNRYLD